MKKLLIVSMLFVPLLAASAQAAPADQWVENYAGEEEQDAYDGSQNTTVNTGAADDDDGGNDNQTAVVTRRQTGPAFVEDSESNDNSEVGGATSVLPIVGNDILNNADVLSNVLNDYSQTDSSSTPINQSRSEDNDQTSVVEDSFNEGVPTVVLEPRIKRVVDTEAVGGRLPTTGFSFLSPLALGIWLVTAGAWMVKTAGGRVLSLRLSS